MESVVSAEELALPGVEGLAALRSGAGWMPLRETGWIAVTGEDRVRWLNGMVTNSVQALEPAEGAYTFLLNAQGRIQGDATVWAEADRLLLETDRAQVEAMVALLDRFIIMDDVELAVLERNGRGLVVAGPGAAERLGVAGVGLTVASRDVLGRSLLTWRTHEVSVISGFAPVVPRFELWFASEDAAAAMARALQESGVPQCDASAFELLRILEARPRFGVDIRDRDLPQETAQVRALHFNKGCYLGQEIVERIRSRGQVHRTFAAFALRGAVPEAGAELQADGKAVGVLTSVAAAEIDGERLALGYVRREAMERGAPITYPGGTAEARTPSAASNA